MKLKLHSLLVFIFAATTLSAQYNVNFDTESKSSYASGTVTLNGIDWDMTEALIGSLSNDYFVGVQSARLRGYGTSSMTMLADKSNGAGTISFNYREYGTGETQVSWLVEISSNSGSTWTQVGSNITGTSSVQNFSEVVDVSGGIRIRIRRPDGSSETANARLNIDDLSITDYTGSSSPIIAFSSATQAESETAGTVSVSMSISPAPAGAETIDVTIADVSATYTDDYTTTSAGTFTVNVSASATSATFDIVLVDDAIMESAESFTATISNPSAGLTLGTTTVLTFTINDDDTPVTTMAIKDVQATTDGESSDELGNTVTIGGIVYGIASNGFYIQDNPGAWNGIFVYDNGTNVVSRGDSVLLTGTVDEFGSVISSAELTTQIKDLTSFEIEMGSPYAMHAAAELSTSAVNDEMYEGVLVKVSQAVVTGEENAFGEWTCSDGSGDTSIDDLLYKDLTPPSIGQIYTVTGAVNHSFGTYKIEPRDADDIILESGVGVDESSINNIEIYPNPSTGLINVINTNNVNVEVYNTLGELVKLTSENQINLTSGFYIVKVGQHTESIIVE